MNKSLYGFIWQFSRGYQLVILAVTIASFPLLYYALELPKVIVNDALGSKDAGAPFPREYFGLSFDQMEYLLTLCALFFLLLLVNGGITMSLYIFKGITSERLLRRLRFQLFERIHRFPSQHFQKTSQGEITSMITAEVEPFSQFFADAVELPLFQGGTMLTVLLFVFVQDPIMGLASIPIIPLQAYIIPKLQMKINLLAKERVVRIRGVAGRISEAVSGINDIHTHDASLYSLADFTGHLGGIFGVRMKIYQGKALLKFLNNFLLKLTPLLFYSVGGVLILNGNLDIGQLVAVLGACSQLMNPWKELLKFYQRMMDAKIKYQQVMEQFDPADMVPENRMFEDRPEKIETFGEGIELASVSMVDDDGVKSLDGISLQIERGNRAIIVAAGAAREHISGVLTGLLVPSQGRVQVGGADVSRMHEAVIGRRLGYAGPESYVFDGTIEYNSFFGMRHAPAFEPEPGKADEKALSEAVLAGNSPHDPNANWISFGDTGVSDEEGLREWWLQCVRALDLEDFFYRRAMGMSVDPVQHPKLAEGILEARKRVSEEIRKSPELGDLIYPFDDLIYNVSATVGANIIFGEALDDAYQTENLGRNPRIRKLLDESGLTSRFLDIGAELAGTIVEMFDGMEADDPIFEKFSFVGEDELTDLKRILGALRREGASSLDDEEKTALVSLPFHLVVEKHRMGHINAVMRTRLLDLRREFRETLTDDDRAGIAFFESGEFNPCLSLRSNLILGRASASRPNAEEHVDELLGRILDEMGLRDEVIRAALDFEVGIGGRRIPLAARQSLVVLRSLVKKPEIMILNEALSAHSREARDRIRRSVDALLPDATFVWVEGEVPELGEFDNVFVIRDGRLDSEDKSDPYVPEQAGGELSSAIAALRRTVFFENADAAQLKLLAFACDRVDYRAGEEIFHQDDEADAAYVVLNGRVDTFVGNGEAEVQVSQTEDGNQLIGEMALLSTRRRAVTARATTTATLLKIDKEMFLQLMVGDKDFAARISRILSDRIYSMTARMLDAA